MEGKVLDTCKVLRLLALKQNIFIPDIFSKSNFLKKDVQASLILDG